MKALKERLWLPSEPDGLYGHTPRQCPVIEQGPTWTSLHIKTGQERAPTPNTSTGFNCGGGELSLSFVLQWCNLTLQIFGGQIPIVFLTAENNKVNASALQGSKLLTLRAEH